MPSFSSRSRNPECIALARFELRRDSSSGAWRAGVEVLDVEVPAALADCGRAHPRARLGVARGEGGVARGGQRLERFAAVVGRELVERVVEPSQHVGRRVGHAAKRRQLGRDAVESDERGGGAQCSSGGGHEEQSPAGTKRCTDFLVGLAARHFAVSLSSRVDRRRGHNRRRKRAAAGGPRAASKRAHDSTNWKRLDADCHQSCR